MRFELMAGIAIAAGLSLAAAPAVAIEAAPSLHEAPVLLLAQAGPSPARSVFPAPPPSSYFIGIGGREVGPLDMDALRDYIAEGTLTPDTLVWTAGLPEWRRAAELEAIAALFPETEPLGPERFVLGSWVIEGTSLPWIEATHGQIVLTFHDDGTVTGGGILTQIHDRREETADAEYTILGFWITSPWENDRFSLEAEILGRVRTHLPGEDAWGNSGHEDISGRIIVIDEATVVARYEDEELVWRRQN